MITLERLVQFGRYNEVLEKALLSVFNNIYGKDVRELMMESIPYDEAITKAEVINAMLNSTKVKIVSTDKGYDLELYSSDGTPGGYTSKLLCKTTWLISESALALIVSSYLYSLNCE